MFDIAPIKPTEGFPGVARNSEGSFIRLKDGRIAFAYSRYLGTNADDFGYSEIAVVYSSDEGETFSEPRILVSPSKNPDDNETNCMSVSLLRLGNGDIGLFYLLKRNYMESVYLLRRSSDELETLSEPVLCVSPQYRNYYVINNDRVLQMKCGRLVIPVAIHPSCMNYLGQVSNDGRALAAFFVSDDDGRSWHQESEILTLPQTSGTNTGLQEPGVVEIQQGVLYAYFRTDRYFQYETVSLDGGKHWFAPQPSRFASPTSPMVIHQNPYSGKFYSVWNPVPEYWGRPKTGFWNGGRTPLVMAEAELTPLGLKWSEPQIIEDDPDSGFCYPALYFLSEGEALLGYCAGNPALGDLHCLVRTRLKKISLPGLFD